MNGCIEDVIFIYYVIFNDAVSSLGSIFEIGRMN